MEELPSVLWAYRTTPRTSTGETPFSMVYGSEAVLPAEIGEESARVCGYDEENEEHRAQDLDLLEERREKALVRMEAYRGRMVRAYNKRVQLRGFQVGDLVIKKAQLAGEVGKLEPRWEGPFKVIQRLTSGEYYLEDDRGRALKRPWNAYHLKKFYA